MDHVPRSSVAQRAGCWPLSRFQESVEHRISGGRFRKAMQEDIIHAFSIARPLQLNHRIRTGFHVHIISRSTPVDGVECAKE